MNQTHIRNFSIIAHIDHGKSTLADRMLEETQTVEARKMRNQVLDSMELERERGITIKMQPVRMLYEFEGEKIEMNLIDTPGHIDFSYEVSRALKAVESSILLVDATQGVQAQTLTTLEMARDMGLVIIPVITKVDSPIARTDEVKLELALLLECDEDEIIEVSGKTGAGVDALLKEVVRRTPPPSAESDETAPPKCLIFDFQYSSHTGVIVYVRCFGGSVKKNDSLTFIGANEKFKAIEVGTFNPDPTPCESLSSGEIGYIVTGIKRPGIASVGDTIGNVKQSVEPLSGYLQPYSVVWASVYPESQDDFTVLKQSLEQLRLSDSSLNFEEEYSDSLGRGFRCGFLGMLHLEIITERLRREFDLELVITTPSITYEVIDDQQEKRLVYTPTQFPDHGNLSSVREPWISGRVITPNDYLGGVIQLMYDHEALVGDSVVFGDNRTSVSFSMPLRELMRNFFDELKSVSSGYASLSYEIDEMKDADVVRLDVFVADEPIHAFSRVVARHRLQEEAEKVVERLHSIMPRQQFVAKIQAKALGRILSSKTLSAFRKDVTAKLYGGDVSRKMKLLQKQKKGKKKMRARGKVRIPQDVFMKIMRSDD